MSICVNVPNHLEAAASVYHIPPRIRVHDAMRVSMKCHAHRWRPGINVQVTNATHALVAYSSSKRSGRPAVGLTAPGS